MKIEIIEKEFWDGCDDFEKAFELIRVLAQNKPNRQPTRKYLTSFITAQAIELEETADLLKKARKQAMIFAILFGGMTLVAAAGWMILGSDWFFSL